MVSNWIHIVIVHLSVLGTPWLLYKVWKHRKLDLESSSWKSNYTALIIVAAFAAGAYFTGPQTVDWVKEVLDTYSQDQVEDHALWGRIAFVIQSLAGLLGIMGWASILQEDKPAKILLKLLLSLLLINTIVLIYTAHLGGVIRRVDLVF